MAGAPFLEVQERQAIRVLRAALRDIVSLAEAAGPAPGLVAIRNHAQRVFLATRDLQWAGTMTTRYHRRLERQSREDPDTGGLKTPGAGQPGRSLAGLTKEA